MVSRADPAPSILEKELQKCVADCTDGKNHAKSWLVKLGIKQNNPNSSRPTFDEDILKEFYAAAEEKKHSVINEFALHKRLKDSIHDRRLWAFTTDSLMNKFAHRIWGSLGTDGHRRHCDNTCSLDCEVEADRLRIRTYLFCWIVHRAYMTLRKTKSTRSPSDDTTTTTLPQDIDNPPIVAQPTIAVPFSRAASDSVIPSSPVQDSTSRHVEGSRKAFHEPSFQEESRIATIDEVYLESQPDRDSDPDYTENNRKRRASNKRKRATKATIGDGKLPETKKTARGQLRDCDTIAASSSTPPSRALPPANEGDELGRAQDHRDADISFAHEDISRGLHSASPTFPLLATLRTNSRDLHTHTTPPTTVDKSIVATDDSAIPEPATAASRDTNVTLLMEETQLDGVETERRAQRGDLQIRLRSEVLTILQTQSLQTANFDHLIPSLELLLGPEDMERLSSNCFNKTLDPKDQGLSVWIAIVRKFNSFRSETNFSGGLETWKAQVDALPKDKQIAAACSCANLEYFMTQVRELYVDAKILAQSMGPALMDLFGSPNYISLEPLSESLEVFFHVLYLRG